MNHSENLVDAETGTHTQNIEWSWRCMRQRLKGGGVLKDILADHLCEYVLRRDVRKKNKDAFTSLIENI